MIPRKTKKRSGSVYIAVTGTALLVSIISMTAMHLARLELRTATALQDRTYARSLAQSSVEMALAKIIDLGPNWRNNLNHDQEYTTSPMGFGATLRYKYLDRLDDNLDNDDTQPVEIQGIGSYGDATFVYSVTYASNVVVLSSYDTPGGSTSAWPLNADNWLGQYFVPALPADAVEWSVTRVDICAEKDTTGVTLTNVRLYEANGEGMPTTLLETVSLSNSELPNSFDWVSINFADVVDRPAGIGLCLGLEGTSSSNQILVQYDGGNVTQMNSHMLEGGSGTWTASYPDKALWYRIHGVYTTPTSSGEFTIEPGSWRRIPAN